MTDAAEAPSGLAPATAVAGLARRMAALPGQPAAFAERALRLAERSDAQRFHIAVLGEFKRGKSTLVNALIGRRLLPSGVVPVTTVVTELHFGDGPEGVLVVFEDGSSREAGLEEIARFVSERDNPANELGVRRVEVRVGRRLGAPGAVLVDTPGLASVSERQTLAARQALTDSDAAVVVLSADAPLSESEGGLLSDLAGRGGEVFVVVNKCDRLSEPELAEVRDFLSGHLERLLGEGASVHYVSARRALEAATGGGPPGRATEPGFDAFRRDLDAFVGGDLAAERDRANAAELDRLAAALSEAVAVERAAAELDLAVLQDRLERFRAAAHDVRRAFAEDRLVLAHALSEIGEAVSESLRSGSAEAAQRAWPEVEASVAGLRGRALDQALDDAVAAAVTGSFDPLRRAIEAAADEGWERAAESLAGRLRQHVQALRTAAEALFAVHLPEAALPTLAGQRERFSYLFLQVESPGSSLARALRTMSRTERARHGMLVRARRRLVSELDKHAGRARFDMVQRLDTVSRRFVTAMAGELERTEASIVAAASSAQRALEASESQRAARENERSLALSVAAEARRLTDGARRAPQR
jgi:GTP-binding protein EngB required for normal cell division